MLRTVYIYLDTESKQRSDTWVYFQMNSGKFLLCLNRAYREIEAKGFTPGCFKDEIEEGWGYVGSNIEKMLETACQHHGYRGGYYILPA